MSDRIKCKPGIRLGSAKLRRPAINNRPPFRPTLLGIGILAYILSKLLVPILSPLTEDEFPVETHFRIQKK